MVGQYNLCINQYATYTKVFTWSAGQCCCAGTVGASSAPVDLTGYTATLQICPFPGGPILYDASSNIVLGGTAGTITLTIPASVTAGFTWWAGVYSLLLTDPYGNVTTLLQGTVTVNPGISV